MLQRVIRGRITFTPNGSTYDFEAATRFDKLFTGVVLPAPPSFVAAGDRRGREHVGPEDTFEADYGRLLERAERGNRQNCGDPGVAQFEPDHRVFRGREAAP